MERLYQLFYLLRDLVLKIGLANWRFMDKGAVLRIPGVESFGYRAWMGRLSHFQGVQTFIMDDFTIREYAAIYSAAYWTTGTISRYHNTRSCSCLLERHFPSSA